MHNFRELIQQRMSGVDPKPGTVYEIHTHENEVGDMTLTTSIPQFVRQWKHRMGFKNPQPKDNGVYVGVVHDDGVYLVALHD